MCGIAGIGGCADRDLLERMVATLAHRGPDEKGVWTADGVSLGMRRLSIIDVETGHQPVFNEDGSVAVVFNGEIYNHIELRRGLEAKGHRFRTDHSDTEVIVHLYEEFGPDFPTHLNGMFAVAVWDLTRRRLVLVRDRAGIKPLYYADLGRELVFGSEPKALLVHPNIGRVPDLRALHHYLALKNVPSPMSAFRDIRQLRPGELLVWDGQSPPQLSRWWRLQWTEEDTISEPDAVSTIRSLLEDAVRLQMRSDVPFGAYLSGGVDSSAVVALMSQLTGQPVKTFTLIYEDGFANKDADRHFATEVSKRYGTEHHEQVVRFGDVPELIDRVIGSFDEPFSGVISTYFLTELIGRHVKLALSGDGADEIFGSYLAHRVALPLSIYRRLKAGNTNLSPDELALMGDFADNPALLERLSECGDAAAARASLYLTDDTTLRAMYSPLMLDAIGSASTEGLVRDIISSSGTDDPLNQALSVDFQMLLPDQVLPFVDRLSMAHSVEVRPPFLDHRLIEFAARLPGRMKMKNGRVKHLLKEAVRDLLPTDLLDRPKEGFLMPLNDWVFTQLNGYIQDVLAPHRLAKHGLLKRDAVAELIARQQAGDKRMGDRLWNLAMLQLWWEKYVGG